MRIIAFLLMVGCLCSGLACGTSGSGSRTPAQWRVVSQDSAASDSESIMSVYFTDVNHGWILTLSRLLETADGGKSWTTRLDARSPKRAFYSMTFVSPTTGVIVGTQGTKNDHAPLILLSIDGGKNWRERRSGTGTASEIGGVTQLNGLSFCNPNMGWAVGSGMVLRTDDGGQTWEAQRSGNQNEMLFSVACVSPKNAYVVGQDGLIIHTEDAGKSWQSQDSRTKDNLMRVRFFGKTGWILGGQAGKGFLLRSNADITDWERVRLDSSEALFDIYMNGRQGWIIGAEGTIFQTKDGGQTWNHQESPTTNSLTSLFFLSPQEGWAGGDRLTLLRFLP